MANLNRKLSTVHGYKTLDVKDKVGWQVKY